jgi:hypothetical protein
MPLKFGNKSAQKESIFSSKASFERCLIEKALFSRKKDRQIQIKPLKIKEINPKLR